MPKLSPPLIVGRLLLSVAIRAARSAPRSRSSSSTVTVTVRSFLSRITFTGTDVPGLVAVTIFTSSLVLFTGAPVVLDDDVARLDAGLVSGASRLRRATRARRFASSRAEVLDTRRCGTARTSTPMRPRVTLPVLSCGSRSRTVLIGTAKPTPMLPSARPLLMMAVFMPMTSPRRFSSGPPELPGLMAASVCSISPKRPIGHLERRLGAADDADRDRVIQVERDCRSRSTQSPAAICDESPNLASGSGWFGFSVSWMSALSVSSSRPTIFAWYT